MGHPVSVWGNENWLLHPIAENFAMDEAASELFKLLRGCDPNSNALSLQGDDGVDCVDIGAEDGHVG